MVEKKFQTLKLRKGAILLLLLICVSFALPRADSAGADWPMWRRDAGRTAAVPEALPAPLRLQWSRALAPSSPAWPATQHKLQFDTCAEPVASGHTLFVPSNSTDSVTAYDTRTGTERWRFYADGPVRFAPIATAGKVWFTSDDGYLYCLDAEDGALLWKFRGGPSAKKVVGNDRLVSAWPARGAPVLVDGKIYFAASIWPFMGIFYHALDAETGETLWTNSGDGSRWQDQPHGGATAFSSLAPQGYMAASGGDLIVPGGRTTPAVLDRETGAIRHFVWDKSGGGGPVFAGEKFYFNGGAMFDRANGKMITKVNPAIIMPKSIFSAQTNVEEKTTALVAFSTSPKIRVTEKTDRKGKKTKTKTPYLPQQWSVELPGALGDLFIKAGPQYFFGAPGLVSCVEVKFRSFIDAQGNRSESETTRVLRTWSVEGDPGAMIAADDRLFVVTRQGQLYCFGANETEPKGYNEPSIKEKPNSPLNDVAQSILKETGIESGYCLVLGAGTGRLAEALRRQSQLRIVALDPDAEKVEALRDRWTRAGLYGKRLAILQGDLLSAKMPPYMASLIVSEDPAAARAGAEGFAEKLHEVLRPYGGVAYFPKKKSLKPRRLRNLRKSLKNANLENADFRETKAYLSLERPGALPESAPWTHQYADSANSVVSKDRLVKAPFGLLWFGGPSNEKILPRHGHGPSPQVVGGRLIIEGPDILRAIDVYTGRLLWEREMPGLGEFYDNTLHHPGAGEIGANYVSMEDAIYVAYRDAIHALDPATGKTNQEFRLPTKDGKAPNWGSICVWEKYIIATSSPLEIILPKPDKNGKRDGEKAKRANSKSLENLPEVTPNARFASSSKQLVVLDRHTGKVLWTRQAAYSFRHNGVIASANKIFCIDALSPQALAYLKRRGLKAEAKPTLYALEAETGGVIWESSKDVFGTWLGYSEENDALVEGTSRYRDRADDETKAGMKVYRGADGEVLWENLKMPYEGPPILHHKRVITNGAKGWDIDLLTGKKLGWSWSRKYGCNTAVASEHLMTFRSGAAGYYDLTGDSGTGNLGGFKSSCTSNLIPADGVLNAPDYTRTCICSYQNQSSIALVHAPEEEMWTYDGSSDPRLLGVNLGAPGNRRGPSGALWLDFPNVGGDPEALPITLEPKDPETFRYHASRLTAGDLPWVAASGLRGLSKITIPLAVKADTFTVRLVFAEVENIESGDRVFDVEIQGKRALKDFDIVKRAKGQNRALTLLFPGIEVEDALTIRLISKTPSWPTVLCGIEVVAE